MELDYRNPYTIGTGIGFILLGLSVTGQIKLYQSQILSSSLVILLLSIFCLAGEYIIEYRAHEEANKYGEAEKYIREKKNLMIWWIVLLIIGLFIVFFGPSIISFIAPKPWNSSY